MNNTQDVFFSERFLRAHVFISSFLIQFHSSTPHSPQEITLLQYFIRQCIDSMIKIQQNTDCSCCYQRCFVPKHNFVKIFAHNKMKLGRLHSCDFVMEGINFHRTPSSEENEGFMERSDQK